MRSGSSPAPALVATLGIGRLRMLARADGGTRSRIADALSRIDRATLRVTVKAVVLTAALILGFLGFQEVDAERTIPGGDEKVKPWQQPAIMWKNAFRTMQLLTTQFPRELDENIPCKLQVARFAVPLFGFWFTLSALLRRFNRPLLASLSGLTSRNHVVLIGESRINLALARAYRRHRRRVVAVTPAVSGDSVSPMEQAGARVVFGDPVDLHTLRRAAIHRAIAVVAADDLGAAAVRLAGAVAAASRPLRRQSGDLLPFLLRLGHRDLRGAMWNQLAAGLRESHVDLRLYVRERTIARGLLGRYPPDWGLPPGEHDIHAAIFGLGEMGGELLLQLARVAVPSPGRRTIVTVIDRDAENLVEQMLAERPGLAHCIELRPITTDVRADAIKAADIEAWLLAPLAATAIYVCCGDDNANLAMAIGLRRVYADTGVVSPCLFIDQRDGAASVEALAEMHGASFDGLRVIAFGSIEEEADPFSLVDEEIDFVAQRVHENYLAKSTGDKTPAPKPWSELDDTIRAANRSQADHMTAKLRALGWHAHASDAGLEPPEIDAGRLEAVARQEHERWCRDRWLAGYTYGPRRDKAARRHPDLVAYDQLDEVGRRKDRDVVQNLASILAQEHVELRSDRRIGIWFADMTSPASAGLIGRVMERLRTTAQDRRHLQLVLALRTQAEVKIASILSRDQDAGVDVALMGSSGGLGIGGLVDRGQARALIAAADRAFVLSPVASLQSPDSACLAALCDVCETVVLVCEKPESVKAMANDIGAGRAERLLAVGAAS